MALICKVFFVSDRTGLTATSYGKSLLSQFPGYDFDITMLTYIDTTERANAAAQQINAAHAASSNHKILVFSTLVDKKLQLILDNTRAFSLELFDAFLAPLETFLCEKSAHTLGMSHTVMGNQDYQYRLDAVDFALAHDDGLRIDHYAQADVILVGVSRCGKTPTSLFLAMTFSLKCANYPLTEEDLVQEQLPHCLLDYRDKLAALTISAQSLSRIREKRRPGSLYASLSACQRELRIANRLIQDQSIPCFDSTDTSIEELAGLIIKSKQL